MAPDDVDWDHLFGDVGVRWFHTGGIFAGLAGAWFTLDFGNSFQAGMTAGRGFIALAALIFGRWMPLGSFGAALLFASASSLSIALRTIPPTGELGDILTALPNSEIVTDLAKDFEPR